ncbi:hypothetical protein [Actinokineospora enzanensis]|uniref:hypothetical protein n=1 Tax=Actinokineospora enzanensis TaxID=155975 RepID=UPI0003800A7B|nr:hypothetical protein [Actinokineospora enzanensis]
MTPNQRAAAAARAAIKNAFAPRDPNGNRQSTYDGRHRATPATICPRCRTTAAACTCGTNR